MTREVSVADRAQFGLYVEWRGISTAEMPVVCERRLCGCHFKIGAQRSRPGLGVVNDQQRRRALSACTSVAFRECTCGRCVGDQALVQCVLPCARSRILRPGDVEWCQGEHADRDETYLRTTFQHADHRLHDT